MERCPIELWHKIFFHACTDGGRTGSALTLVSRRVRDIAQSVRYHSVSLVGQNQFLAFARMLTELSIRPTISHLFISAHVPPGSWSTPTTIRAKHLSLEQAFAGILAVAAPALKTLMIHDSPHFDVTAASLSFPLLTDLSTDFLRSRGDSTLRARFPCIRRLHLSECYTTYGCWDEIALLAPSITHVRFSGISMDAGIAPFLRVLLDIPADVPYGFHSASTYDYYVSGSRMATHATEIAAVVRYLKEVYVQLRSCRVGTETTVCHAQTKSELEYITKAGAVGLGNGRLYLLNPSESYDLRAACEDWLDVVDGGDGPWASGSEGRDAPCAHYGLHTRAA